MAPYKLIALAQCRLSNINSKADMIQMGAMTCRVVTNFI